jgi:hypothetical protein
VIGFSSRSPPRRQRIHLNIRETGSIMYCVP